jgi:alkylated DNA repair dioxygenase AlkB
MEYSNFNMEKLVDNNLDVIIFKNFLNQSQADWMLEYCLQNVTWGQDKYIFSGKGNLEPREVLAPRLTSLYGDKPYTYSGQTLYPTSFTKALERLKSIISEQDGTDYNVVLLNQYRDGKDSVSWHTDSERALGKNPSIASISLGGSKPFKLREISNKKNQHEILLEHGDLIIMQGKTQHFWEHSIQKSKKYNELRVNLTFRKII